MKYRAWFYGRRKGAIGIFHQCSDVVDAESTDRALLALYENWEHISGLRFEEVAETPPEEL